jgi:hypothetical protein
MIHDPTAIGEKMTTKKTTTTMTTKEEGIIKGTSRALDAQAYRVWVHASTTLDSVALMQWHSGQDGECGRRRWRTRGMLEPRAMIGRERRREVAGKASSCIWCI